MRCRRNSASRFNGGGLVKDSRNKVEVSSRFASLVTEDAIDDREGFSAGDFSLASTVPEPIRIGPLSPVVVTTHPKITKNDVYRNLNPEKKSKEASHNPE
ncbi:hypothetical protein V6N13_065891 [Hibiscus sabdariffa]